MDLFTNESQVKGVTEIAVALGFHKSSTHSLLQTLREEGYVIYDPQTKKYSLGYKPLDLAGRITYRRDLREIALPMMRRLSKTSEEDVALNILVEGRTVTNEVVESRYFIRHIIPFGVPYPLHCRAAGKVILAFLSPEEIETVITKYGLQRFTEKTITDRDRLFSEVEKIRREGYSVSRQEFGPEGVSVAFPLFNKHKRIIASLSIHSTVNRYTEEAGKRFIAEGLVASNKINEILRII